MSDPATAPSLFGLNSQLILTIYDTLSSHMSPPLDQNAYRYGFGLVPATYFFVTDVIYFITALIFGTGSGTIVVNAIDKVKESQSFTEMFQSVMTLIKPKKSEFREEFEKEFIEPSSFNIFDALNTFQNPHGYHHMVSQS